jgi:hypothetical protein
MVHGQVVRCKDSIFFNGGGDGAIIHKPIEEFSQTNQI